MKKLFINNLPPLFILLAVLFFFISKILVGKVPIPSDALIGLYHPWRDIELDGYNKEKYPVKNPLTTDPVLQTYPWRKVVIENIKSGSFPLWNPYNFSGQPLAANVQSAPFVITNIFFFIFPFNISWAMQIILGSLITSIFTYLLLRSLNLQKISSAYGAVILPFTGFFIAWLTWGTVDLTAAYLPLILLLVNKISEKVNVFYFLVLTFSLSQLFLSGHSQTAIYTIMASLLYLLFTSVIKKNWKILLPFFLSFFLAVAIALPQLVSSLEFAIKSNRAADQAYFPQKEDWFIPQKHLAQILAPDFFGNPTRGNYWGTWNYAEFVSYIGILPLFFVILSLFKLNKKLAFFSSLVFLSLLLGLKNPVSQIPYILNFPIISSMQPSRIIYLLTFSLVILSAFGFESFLENKNIKKQLVSLSIILLPLLALMALVTIFKGVLSKPVGLENAVIASRNLILPIAASASIAVVIIIQKLNVPKGIITILVFFLTLSELFYFSYKFTPFSSFNTIYPETETIKYLRSQGRPFRVMSTDRRIANPNSLTVYKIESVSGYDPLYLKDYAQLVDTWESDKAREGINSFNRFVTPSNYSSTLTNLMNVKYILSFDDILNPRFELVLQEGKTRTYRNRDALERVFFVREIESKPNDVEVLKAILNNSNLKEVAYATNFSFKGGDEKATAKIINYNDQSLIVNTQTEKDTPLIISNVYFPGWKVYIDGKEESLNKVNYMLQSVVVPTGNHSVKLAYRPDIFFKSLYVSFSSILLLIFFSLIIWKKSQS